MRVVFWGKVILFGATAAVVLNVIALLIDELVRPKRESLMLDLSYLVYLVVLLIAGVSGVIVSIAVLISRSEKISILAALFVGLTISTGLIKGSLEIFSGSEYFDAPMFYADIIQIVLNLIIYPSVCLLIWRFFRKELVRAN